MLPGILTLAGIVLFAILYITDDMSMPDEEETTNEKNGN